MWYLLQAIKFLVTNLRDLTPTRILEFLAKIPAYILGFKTDLKYFYECLELLYNNEW